MAGRPGRAVRILIVDDDEEICSSLRDLIESEQGYDVETASRITDAQHLASALCPNIALVDVKLGSDYGLDVWDRRKNGEEFPKRLSISAIQDEHAALSHYVGVSSDISALNQAQLRLQHLAHHDALTDLPNRALLLDRLQIALSSAARGSIAVLFVDLDRFKYVNDTLGHRAGDELLVEAARRLREVIREEDTVARLGGDEFTIVLTEVSGPEIAETIAARVVETLARPFVVGDEEVLVSASVGVALSSSDGTEAEMLLRNADTAMYCAKERGKNSYQFFDEEMNAKSEERRVLEASLRQAVDRQELFLHYQPKFDLCTLQVVGVEALLRWQHPALGMVPPASFIPVAEDSYLIVEIGRFVLREACRQAKAWQRDGLPPIPVAVNLSARQFREEGLVDQVAATLAQAGLAPEYLELELTESLIMDDVEQNARLLADLKALGVRISIDDFGTGYSSLSYLKRLPVDTIKIDQSFVSDLTEDADNEAIVSTIIAMARTMSLNVIAEGVETRAQLDALSKNGCHEVQGFLLGRPLPGERIEEALRNHLAGVQDSWR